MDPTVTNGGGMTHASTLAEKAAGALGFDGEVAAADLSWASMALSLAEMAKSTRIRAEQAVPEPQREPAVLSADSPVGTVAVVGPKRVRYVRCCDIPLVADCWRRTADPSYGRDVWVSFEWLQENGAVLLAAGPVPLASADTLPREELDAAIAQVYGYLTKDDGSLRDRSRRLVDAVNARLRAQFPDETPLPEPAVPFVRGVDELSDDELDEVYRLANGFTPNYYVTATDRRHALAVATAIAARLRVDGPQRSPVDAADVVTAEMLDAAEVGAAVVDSKGHEWRKCNQRRWDSGTLCRSSNWLLGEGKLSNLRPPSQPAQPERLAGWASGQPSRERLAAAALNLAAELVSYSGPDSAYASLAADVDAAARAHVKALHGPTVGADVLSIARALTDDTIGTGGYDVAKLAPGSVVFAALTRVYLCVNDNHGTNRWIVTWHDGEHFQWSWRFDGDVPPGGVLVVDGATLGGQS